MNIEEAIGMTAAELEKMDEAACKLHFDHYLIVTRPERAPRADSKTAQPALSINPQFEKARQLAATLGINIPAHTPLKKKGR